MAWGVASWKPFSHSHLPCGLPAALPTDDPIVGARRAVPLDVASATSEATPSLQSVLTWKEKSARAQVAADRPEGPSLRYRGSPPSRNPGRWGQVHSGFCFATPITRVSHAGIIRRFPYHPQARFLACGRHPALAYYAFSSEPGLKCFRNGCIWVPWVKLLV